jgi:hypothetical protein
MTTFTWQVVPTKVEAVGNLNNVVVELNLNLIADDAEIRRIKSTTVSLGAPQESFVPYEQLTEQQVLGWGLDNLGEEQIESMQKALLVEIEWVKASATNLVQQKTIVPPWVVAQGE